MLKLKLTAVLALAMFLSACGGGGGDSSSSGSKVFNIDYYPAECSEAAQTEFVYKAMHDVYYWADTSPVLDYKAYDSQYDLIYAMRNSKDVFSTIYTKQFINDYYSGSNIGLGLNTITDGTGLYIRMVYPDSPADLAGLERGNRIMSVNGYSAEQMLASSSVSDAAFGPSTAGYSVTIDYLDNSNVSKTAVVSKAEYYADSAPVYDIFTNSGNGKKIGYLFYNSFNENTSDTTAAMEAFRTAGVSELVIDLRYNGGGLVKTAQYIGSFIGGSGLSGLTMLKMIFNNKYSGMNSKVSFADPVYALDVDKVVFLVTGATASASELVINGLKPFKDVYLIGSNTYGKPVGSHYIGYCDKYLSAVTFENKNTLDEGGYFSGISADCRKYENVDSLGQFGSEDEKFLGAALNYLQTGGCVSEPASMAKIKVAEKEIHAPWDEKIIK
ncbi:S41 family peptidase [Seleniivibrio woodruffii]|uniref:S41 family peptidase n=1 Tax=Seleniivibrio woodruffii TaxID=1078050 RepID=UPI002409BCB8|nr:S41 family peptidase [Seleniivibrio woodruffii]